MKLAILSRGPRSYSTRRLKEAAQQRDHTVKVLDTLKFAIDLQSTSWPGPGLQALGRDPAAGWGGGVGRVRRGEGVCGKRGQPGRACF